MDRPTNTECIVVGDYLMRAANDVAATTPDAVGEIHALDRFSFLSGLWFGVQWAMIGFPGLKTLRESGSTEDVPPRFH